MLCRQRREITKYIKLNDEYRMESVAYNGNCVGMKTNIFCRISKKQSKINKKLWERITRTRNIDKLSNDRLE